MEKSDTSQTKLYNTYLLLSIRLAIKSSFIHFDDPATLLVFNTTTLPVFNPTTMLVFNPTTMHSTQTVRHLGVYLA